MSDGQFTLEILLEELHIATAGELLNRVRSGKASASELNVARQMLKDNNIELRPNATSPLGKLADELPDAFDVDDQYPTH
ncbi:MULTISPECIES: hypothetical protein [unclassified Marinobacter]|uniref:hypothetical protein n=1 Tax=unclassified Marinobacter TaxID=83889 RepID=UPI0012696826|nr:MULTISPECIES: hypothetical protein [unclassified Marinobacter]QFS87580.1 hypothetical protein FIV08_12175 [Marinobacter sp. THAF197a]QFT51365.1 hypothetical protein FIU96_12090 [Marinobacter sp. THAF39]